MGSEGKVWRLVRKDELVGEIVIEDADFPWLRGRFTAGPVFPELKPMFERSLALVEAEEWEEFDIVYTEIERALSLISPTGPVAEFLLHIQDDLAWFRWSDEAFDDE